MSIVFGDPARDTERFQLTLSDEVTVIDSLQSLMGHLDANPDEDLVIVGPDAPMSVAVDVASKYRLNRPPLGVILIRRRVDVQTLAEALRAGIREVVVADDAEALLGACKRSTSVSRQQRHAEESSTEGAKGKVIMVFSAKGGCGKTTIASNLADAIALLDVGRVCLVDFNLEFGDIAIALQIDPVRTISDALGMQGGLDKHGVASMVIPYKDRLDVLLAPTMPADAEFIQAPLAGEVLRLLSEVYDYVIIDSPPAFSDITLKCFDIADSYILLTTLDMLALKNFKLTLDTLSALGYPRSRWNVVLNRSDSRVGLTAEDMERTIGLPIVTKLPSTKDVPASINRGTTLVSENRRHPFSRAIMTLAEQQCRGAAATHDGGGRSGRRPAILSRAASIS
jgi:pilus assembly protein CpaE